MQRKNANSCLSDAAKSPIILCLAALLVFGAHKRVMHNGVKETLAEL